MTREQAIQAYNRAREVEQRMSERLRQEILIPFFGGCGCRMHNCKINFENGFKESPVEINGRTYSHQELAKLAKRFDHEQNKIWRTIERLQKAFAKYF